MTFLWEQGIPVIKLDMIATLALAILLLLLGRVMVNRITILGRFLYSGPGSRRVAFFYINVNFSPNEYLSY